MLGFLKTIFGDDLCITPYNYPEKTPYYIRDNYRGQHLSWMQNECILLSPNTSAWRLPTLKKQLKNFQELCEKPCALCLENLTANQRRNLVESHVPFISLSQQVYLPFWGCSFMERFKVNISVEDKMAPGTQLVFLYFYYSAKNENINLTKLSKELLLSKATCTRAVSDLTASGLLVQRTEGTNKWLTPAFEKSEFLKKGYARLKSPVNRLVYVKNTPIGTFPLSGIQALSAITMVEANLQDGGIAVSRKAGSKIAPETILSRQEFNDFGGSIIEIWNYDPALFARDGRVDDISLLLSLESDPDERIQMGLDEIREKHKLPVKYEK